MINFIPDRLGHDKCYAIDPSKLENLEGKPLYNFETGMAQTIQWYQHHQKWWEQIINEEYQTYFNN